jgi:hypothetical protein
MRKIIQPRKLLTFTAVNEQHGKRKMPRSTLLSLPVIAAMLLMPLPSEGTTKNVSGGPSRVSANGPTRGQACDFAMLNY